MKEQRGRLTMRKRYYALLFLLIVGILFYKSDWLWEWLYPVQYEQDIQVSAANYKVDPYLIAAIIRVESNFKTEVESHKGAVGVMQLMPDTASWVVEKSGYSPDTLLDLHRPDVNIEIGTKYLDLLNRQFQGNQAAVIAAYNAGPGNVSKWLQARTWDGTEAQLDQIPFGETRHYVQRVQYYYRKYKQVYGEKWTSVGISEWRAFALK